MKSIVIKTFFLMLIISSQIVYGQRSTSGSLRCPPSCPDCYNNPCYDSEKPTPSSNTNGNTNSYQSPQKSTGLGAFEPAANALEQQAKITKCLGRAAYMRKLAAKFRQGNQPSDAEMNAIPPCDADYGNSAATAAGQQVVSEQQLKQQALNQQIAAMNALTNGVVDLIRSVGVDPDRFARQTNDLQDKISAINNPRKQHQPTDNKGIMGDAKRNNLNMDDLGPGEEDDNGGAPIADVRPLNGAVNENLEKILPAEPVKPGTLVTQPNGTIRIDYPDGSSQFIGSDETQGPVSPGKQPMAQLPSSPNGKGSSPNGVPSSPNNSQNNPTSAPSSPAMAKVRFKVTGKKPPSLVRISYNGRPVGAGGSLWNTQKTVVFDGSDLPVGTVKLKVYIRYSEKLPNNDPGTGGKQQKTTFPDGSILITEPEGSQRMIKPDGSIQHLGNAGPGNYVPVWKNTEEEFFVTKVVPQDKQGGNPNEIVIP
ncbi:hypothetical protein ACS5NO_21600 [Larkinella sp. GY13]|uniref:hypothetical protein n=1 Tax=Larkinella sp. GY13 TaxID=3453720 RepID=UPI003EE90F42